MFRGFVFCLFYLMFMAAIAGEKRKSGKRPGEAKECKKSTLQIVDSNIIYEYNLGHVIDTVQVVSVLQCQDLCLRNTLCVGFNYHICSEGSSLRPKTCEILSSLGAKQKNECVAFKKFDYEQVHKDLLQSCESDHELHS